VLAPDNSLQTRRLLVKERTPKAQILGVGNNLRAVQDNFREGSSLVAAWDNLRAPALQPKVAALEPDSILPASGLREEY
jgi:hypothetical protein